jgi:hypothetical protein
MWYVYQECDRHGRWHDVYRFTADTKARAVALARDLFATGCAHKWRVRRVSTRRPFQTGRVSAITRRRAARGVG